MSGDKMRTPNGTLNVFQILGNISSIYHRHIEHIFGGSTVFSLISGSTRRL